MDIATARMSRVLNLRNCGRRTYDAGHAISTERPEAFVEVVADFLERHEAFVISRTETVVHP
jgi:hypothetical protein